MAKSGPERDTPRARGECRATRHENILRSTMPSIERAGGARRGATRFLAALGCLASAASARAQAPRAHPAADTAFAVPAWAFPVLGTNKAPSTVGSDTGAIATLPTSRARFTVGHARNGFDVADWNPETHAAPPSIVLHGRRPAVMACGFCHLADGRGRPENAMLAGLPAAYIVEQVHDLHSRARGTASPVPFPATITMRGIADSVTDEELEAAARYFSGLHARRLSRVVEADVAPKSVALTGLYALAPEGGTEPLDGRIIELPLDLRRHELHDPMARYVAYVPKGSLARGRALARGRVAGTKGCTSCHGEGLRGMGVAPPLAGRSPTYVLRQLVGFRTGARSGPAAQPMREETAALTLDDMIAAAAYAGSLEP
jgi:cytochrome c553